MLIKVLTEELDYSMNNLATADGVKPYFILYNITDEKTLSVAAELGAITRDNISHERMLDVDVRVAVGVDVGVRVLVDVAVAVRVGVAVGVGVDVAIAVPVGVVVLVGVGVADPAQHLPLSSAR